VANLWSPRRRPLEGGPSSSGNRRARPWHPVGVSLHLVVSLETLAHERLPVVALERLGARVGVALPRRGGFARACGNRFGLEPWRLWCKIHDYKEEEVGPIGLDLIPHSCRCRACTQSGEVTHANGQAPSLFDGDDSLGDLRHPSRETYGGHRRRQLGRPQFGSTESR